MSFEIGNIYWFPVPIQLLFSSYETHNDFTNFSDKLLFFHLNLLIIINLERIWTTHSKKCKKINSFRHVLRKWNLFDKHTFQSQFHVIDFYSNISMDIYHFVLLFFCLSIIWRIFFLLINVAKLPLGLLAQFHAYSSDYFVKLHPHLKLLLMLQPEMKIDVWYVIIM